MSWRRFILRDNRLHPAWRALIFIPFYFLTSVFSGTIFALAFSLFSGQPPSYQIASPLFIGVELVSTASVCLLVFLFRRLLDGKSFRSLGFEVKKGWLKEIGLGFALGFLLMALVFATHVLAGWAKVGNLSPYSQAGKALFLTLLFLIPAALNEEIAFRGYFLQNLEEAFGTWWAVGISSLVFSSFHFLNPHFSWLAFLNIVLAGLLFAVAYLLTRNLWLPIALHFSWNYFQGPVFGFPVSGLRFPSLLALEISSGALPFSGGSFGPEGGLTGTLATLLGLAILWLWARRNAPRL
jgi:membrane protease YdiL (CAAX protease family)